MSIRRNTMWNLAGNGLPFLVGVVTIPYLLRHLGIEAFGILTMVWGFIGYFSLFDFGLGRALTQQVASRRAAGKQNDIAQMVKTGLLFTLFTGVLGGMLLMVLARPLATDWLRINIGLQHQTLQCLIVSAVGIPLTTTATGLRGVLEAYEDFKWVNFLRMGLGIATFGLPALCVVLAGPSLVWIALSLVLIRLLVLLAHVVLVNRRLKQGWWQTSSSGQDLKNLLSFGVWMTVSNIVGPLMVTADRYLISATLGAGVVAYYTVPFEALSRILIIPAAVSVTLFPRMATHFVTASNEAKTLYFRSIRVVALVLAPVCLVCAAGSYWALARWLGPDFANQAWLVTCILSGGIFLNGLAALPFCVVQATGKAKYTALLHVGELIVYVPMLIAAMRWGGIVGAASVWVIRAGIDLACLMLLAHREFGEIDHA